MFHVLGKVSHSALRALRARRRCDASAASAVTALQEPAHPPPRTKSATTHTPPDNVTGTRFARIAVTMQSLPLQ